MNKEELILQKHLLDLSKMAYHRDIVTYSDFLNLNELNILHSTPKNLFSTQYETFGGYEYAERQMVAFLPDALYYEHQYPIQILRITPINVKFSEELGHRDYLGSILNLGIERSKLGDLAVMENEAILFCQESMSSYIKENLNRIRHTMENVEKVEMNSFTYEPTFQEITGTVASIRLDSVLSIAFPISRSKLVGYIEGGKVFVNGKLITTNGYRLKDGDIISVRKMGRIRYEGVQSETRKGRYLVRIEKYS